MKKLIFPAIAVALVYGYFAFAESVDFTTSVTVDPVSPTVGQVASINATIAPAAFFNDADAIVQFKIFTLASPSTLVLENNFEHQNFVATPSHEYNFGWTASVSGDYVVKVGVFNHDWAIAYFWNDNAASISVGAAPTPTPTPEATPTPTPEPTPAQVSGGAVPLWMVQEQSKLLQQQDLEWAIANGLATPTPTPAIQPTTNPAPVVIRTNVRAQVEAQAEIPVTEEPENSPEPSFSPISRPALDSANLEANINQPLVKRILSRILDIFR